MSETTNCFVGRYHEIALKGGNRKRFVSQLVGNIRTATADLPVEAARARMGRIELPLRDPACSGQVEERLGRVFGLVNFSLARRGSRDLDELARQILEALAGTAYSSFRVAVKRSDKSFPGRSPDIAARLGGHVKMQTGAKVDLENPDLAVLVEILPKHVYFSVGKIAGPGGLPVGTGGLVACLLSGGIDSPVAAYRMMKRGCRVLFIHFHSVPYLDASSQEKTRELTAGLTRHQFHSKLFLVPFGEIQRQIVLTVPRPYRVVLYRRLMLRIAECLARRHKAQALVTGESLGQVASQTLENLSTIEGAVDIPILRPLIGMDKSEITAQADRIGTLPVSNLPDQDCCQLFIPRHPATRVSRREADRLETGLNLDAMIQAGVEGAVIVRYRFPGAGGSPELVEDADG